MLNTIKSKKNGIFLIYYSVITACMTFPGLFDLANTIEPWVIGLPFSIFYLFSCVALLCTGLCVQFFVERKLGELDIEVSPIDIRKVSGGEES
ncbi:hypothetical protein QWY16_09175 [Planococcus shenhongbingii]|uniref:DUF485 domain-containing protein n=1 Tax=Planococcus shenhongbingii TaxID=3058398 RepID=A0ABT8ND75_9BACL|nr:MULTISPECIES: hypothetical protein [unclassified Planococcus (in: firmicutes)]MDN7245632.1 hypothetical protein [Planococcus sp. N017]WKA60257.1 hypothetical protein QWY16_09175 [Planococcus sp. N016]